MTADAHAQARPAREPAGRAGIRLPGNGRLPLVLAVAAFVIVVDAVTKILATQLLADREPVEILGGLIRLGFYRNFAGSNNILPGHTVLISIFAAVAVVVLLVVALRVSSRLGAVVVGLLIGGAVGNLLDRALREPSFLHGGVIDWLKLTGRSNWMNVADLAINLAIILIVVAALLGWRRERAAGDEEPAAARHPESSE